MLIDQLLHHRPLCNAGVFHTIEQPAVQQKPTLPGVADHLQTGFLPSQRDAGEVDVGGDVLVAHICQRVRVSQMPPVAHHRAHAALRVVILVLGKSIVNHEDRASLQAVCQRADKAFGLLVDFCYVIVRAINFQRRPQAGELVGINERTFVHRDAAFVPHAL